MRSLQHQICRVANSSVPASEVGPSPQRTSSGSNSPNGSDAQGVVDKNRQTASKDNVPERRSKKRKCTDAVAGSGEQFMLVYDARFTTTH